MYQAYYDSELGLLEITANEEGITSVIFVEERKEEHKNEFVEQCINELDEYFEGKRKEFTVPLSAEGTPFQKNVWDALYTVPYGVSASYLDIAEKVGNTKAVRAIGGQIAGINFNYRSMPSCNRKEWKTCWVCGWFMEERVVIET